MDLWTFSKHCLELERHKKQCGTLKVNTPEVICRGTIDGLNDCLELIEADEALIFAGKETL